LCRNRAVQSDELEFCFDNSFSHISTKAVFFQLKVTEDDTTTTAIIDDFADETQELLPFEITYENFKVYLVSFLFRN